MRTCTIKVTNINKLSTDSREITSNSMRSLKSAPRVWLLSKVDLRRSLKDWLKREIDCQKISNSSRTKETRRLMRWKSNSTEKRNCLSRRILTCNKSPSKLSPSKLRWFSLTRPTEPSGTRRRASCFLLRKMQLLSKRPFKGRMKICSKKSRDSKSKTRETLGNIKSLWMSVRWKLTTRCFMVLAAVFWTGSTLEELAKVFRNQMAKEVLPKVNNLVMEPIDPSMELTRAWMVSN